MPGEIESGFSTGCAFDPTIIHRHHAWRLNQTTGRFEPVDPDKVACPKDD